MKKLGALFLILSAVSFAGYQEINAKYNQLESQFTNLVNLENQQYAKLRANAEVASRKLDERQRLKAALEDRIAKIEGSAGAKFFKTHDLKQNTNSRKNYSSKLQTSF